MNNTLIILDFDGTYIVDNSSRELEKIIYGYLPKHKKLFVKILHIFKKFFSLIGIFMGFKDLYLELYLLLVFSELNKIKKNVFNIVVTKLRVNTCLIDYLFNNYSNKKYSFLSNGLREIIEVVIKDKKNYSILSASFIDFKDKKIYIHSIYDKVKKIKELLLQKNEIIFFTDSWVEALFFKICFWKNIKKFNTILNNNFKIYEIKILS